MHSHRSLYVALALTSLTLSAGAASALAQESEPAGGPAAAPDPGH